ncbi:hypothetical protein K0M31_016873, partial [Melipona bicolor]
SLQESSKSSQSTRIANDESSFLKKYVVGTFKSNKRLLNYSCTVILSTIHTYVSDNSR